MTSKEKEVILLPIFEECKKYTLDPFWKEVLSSCSKNKFPKGIRYNPTTNVIYVKDKSGKNKTFQLENEARSIFTTLIQIFKEEYSMFSPMDIVKKREEIGILRDEDDVSREWKNLKPKILKDFYILDYVLELSNKHNLSNDERKKLYDTIQSSINFNKITALHIDYNVEERRIINISGLSYDKKRRIFKVTNESVIPHKSEKNSTDKRIYQAIDKFIREKKILQDDLS